MANEISLVTASGRTVTPKDDGIIYEVFSPGNGIIYGGAVTIKDSSTLHITAGHGIVCGRKFTIDDSDIPVALSGSGSLLGRLYIHLDLADAADPITLLVETGASLTPVVQDSDVNINNGVYEINIATFDVDTVTISNLVNLDVTVAPMGDMEGATSALDGKGGYVPAPQAGDEDKVLKGDGTWGMAGDTASVRYDPDTGYIQYTTDGGTTWVNLINTSTPVQLLPAMTSNTSVIGTASVSGTAGSDVPSTDAYKVIDDSNISYEGTIGHDGASLAFEFTEPTFVKSITVIAHRTGSGTQTVSLDWSLDGITWISGNQQTLISDYQQLAQAVNATVKAIRYRFLSGGSTGSSQIKQLKAWN